MGFRPKAWWQRLQRKRAAEQWRQMEEQVSGFGRARLARRMDEARTLRESLGRFLHRADERTRLSHARLADLPLPGGTDWRWRPGFLAGRVSPSGMAGPQSGDSVGELARLWHDDSDSPLILRQVANSASADMSPFALRLEVLDFKGSYLSLSVDLPVDAQQGLQKNHVLRLETDLQVERPISIYARLNVQHGPNTDELLRHLGEIMPGQSNHPVTEFDLALINMNEKRLEKIWLDLIFEAPHMNAVELRDMFISRHPRAEV
ncbi:MAG: DUF6478 family protein [Paracoccus sp. (in: a-proteobacteria)]|uniref:DUF6478 family protein n=1 Tax=Paracoccus sp. TaxID=267 RepID=UPI0026DFEE36|nr:DUF6478 family protein [Paracoccus sp. (in: a-proteobacteria)]MDO5621187.1 DUF6478 family protein [Paracoccus sp. (in: a-proteobacteria)]